MSDVIELASTSTEQAQFAVSAKQGSSYVNPTSGTTFWAFMAHEVIPAPADWLAAAWEIDNSGARPVYYSTVTLGPGGITAFASGYYDVWGRVVYSGVDVQKRVGFLIVDQDLLDGVVSSSGQPTYRLVITSGLSSAFNTTVGAARFYADGNYNITKVIASVGTPSSGGSTVITLKKNGSPYGTLTMNAGDQVDSITLGNTSFNLNDYLTADVQCNGTGQKDLLIEVFLQRVS